MYILQNVPSKMLLRLASADILVPVSLAIPHLYNNLTLSSKIISLTQISNTEREVSPLLSELEMDRLPLFLGLLV